MFTECVAIESECVLDAVRRFYKQGVAFFNIAPAKQNQEENVCFYKAIDHFPHS